MKNGGSVGFRSRFSGGRLENQVFLSKGQAGYCMKTEYDALAVFLTPIREHENAAFSY